jgi:hypothetical protein
MKHKKKISAAALDFPKTLQTECGVPDWEAILEVSAAQY